MCFNTTEINGEYIGDSVPAKPINETYSSMIIINLSIFMIADRITTKWISKLLLIIWVVLVECFYSPINLSYIVLLCVSGGIVLIEQLRERRKNI